MSENDAWSQSSVQLNLLMYFNSRKTYSRFHYTDIYNYAIEIMKYLDGVEEQNEKRDKLVKELEAIYLHPLRLHPDTNRRPYLLANFSKSHNFHQLEYIAYRFTGMILSGRSNAGMTRRIQLGANQSIEFGAIVDILQTFKNKVHANLMECLRIYRVEMKLPDLGPSYDPFSEPVGFHSLAPGA